MLKKIGIGFVAVLGVFALVVATRPAAFHIERSMTIDAPPDVVFPLVNDFHAWLRRQADLALPGHGHHGRKRLRSGARGDEDRR